MLFVTFSVPQGQKQEELGHACSQPQASQDEGFDNESDLVDTFGVGVDQVVELGEEGARRRPKGGDKLIEPQSNDESVPLPVALILLSLCVSFPLVELTGVEFCLLALHVFQVENQSQLSIVLHDIVEVFPEPIHG